MILFYAFYYFQNSIGAVAQQYNQIKRLKFEKNFYKKHLNEVEQFVQQQWWNKVHNYYFIFYFQIVNFFYILMYLFKNTMLKNKL